MKKGMRISTLSKVCSRVLNTFLTAILLTGYLLTGTASAAEIGNPEACEQTTLLPLDTPIEGELSEVDDCYIDDAVVLADLYKIDLTDAPGVTHLRIYSSATMYYPQVGVLDRLDLEDARDIVDTMVDTTALLFEVSLLPGEYVVYIHGGTYQPQNQAAAGPYT